ncbi:structural maintenance of chromosomes protein 6-like [Latimeria chalumnae]|uniref:Structural maintenance of chromosomes protein 6 n=1 Tax=Latimeria chalumnae TaxID=7897 RepID=H3B2B2_LATCH|nr:PREDICTED: structural maintenance of chromosomes protein 6 [Latimeria chalumnae]|eukprot:XP_005997583.1 PREDICTED: structural maintenance of chromosomes protein 6 [Latimeria chalumnae]
MGKRKEENFAGATPHKKAKTDEEESDDADNEENMQRFHSDNNYNTNSDSGEVGIIECVSLKNFMCHALLGPFKFGENVNFVVGNNGSGKSAVLTALIVGLGGKATATNRGSSLRGFVREGQSSADVSITLRNRGSDAFKPEVYGPSINVQQRLTGDGSRSYKLKSATGQLISTKKEELTAVLDHFNIQVDNPISILTQEMSKHFLQTKNEADKYKFFMKATQLEQMKEDYSYIMETKAVTNGQIELQEEHLAELKRQTAEKEERFKMITSLDDMKEKLEELKHQMAWAQVNELEKHMQPFKDRINTEEGRTVKYDQKVEEFQVKVNEAEEKYKAIQDKLDRISEEAQVLHPQCTALKKEVQVKKEARIEAETSYNRHRTELRQLEKDYDQLQKKIEELKSSVNQSSEAERLERLQRIAQLQEQLQALRDQDITISQQVDQFQQAILKYKEEHSRLRREEGDERNIVNSLNKQLKEMKASRTDGLKRFGEHMPAMIAKINEVYKKGLFTKKPVGPLGACIHLKDPQLALAVESCLKGLLLAFCCDNHRDEKILQNVMAPFYVRGQRPQIIVAEFRNEIYNVRQRAVTHPEFPSVLTALDIRDPVVANVLIDMRGIESILLIKNNSVARQVMQQQQPPRNCREAFTGDGDQVFSNRYYSSEYNRAKFLSRDIEAEISHLDREVENKMAQLSTFQQRLRSLGDDIKQNEELYKRHQQNRKQVQDKIRRINLEVNELENVEEPQSVDISTLEEEAEDVKEKITSVKQDVERARQIMDEQRSILSEAESKYRSISQQIHSVAEEADPIKEELHKADAEVGKCKHHKQHYERKRKDHLDNINKLKAELTTKEMELEEKIAQAKQIYPDRLEVSRTAKSLDTEMTRLREKINSEQEQHGNRAEIVRQYHEAVEMLKSIVNQVKNLKRFIKLLDEIMTKRHKAYHILRRYISLRCRYYFDSLLSQRNYLGKMMFDHKNETLAITVQPGEGCQASLSDMRSLSGGERSFSTVCFILSLWGIAESPFRCLDEFDVYMDMVNRRISMDMMLKMADSQKFRQFIFLTPQNMSSLPTSNFIRIFRMPDPERGQTLLPFRPRNQENDED